MSQELNQDHSLWNVALPLAADKKVFLTSGAQSLCHDLLAAGVLELVCIGETSEVEGVKARVNFRERRSSKDLIIDCEGAVPLETAAKLLKKTGVFISAVDREWDESFSEVGAVGWVDAGTDEEGMDRQALNYLQDGFNASFWIAAKGELPDLPVVERVVESIASLKGELDRALSELAELKGVANKAERAKRAAQTHRAKMKEELKETLAVREELTEERDHLKGELRSLKRKLTKSERLVESHEFLQTKHEELQEEAEQTRETLILREGELAKTKKSLKRANKEVDRQKEDLARQETALSEQRTLSGKLERTLELRADDSNRAARAEHNAAEATAAYHSVAKGWIDWAQAGLERELPQPPAPRGDLAITWTRQIQAQRPMVTSALDEYQEVSQLREALQRAEREMLQLNKEREEARAETATLRGQLKLKDSTLIQSLEAERALRLALDAELQERSQQLSSVQEELSELQAQLDESHRALDRVQNTELQEDARVAELSAQLRVQRAQKEARERLMEMNHQLQRELTTALEQEIEARGELERRLDAAEAELRTLKVEQRYPSTQTVREESDHRPSRSRREDQSKGKHKRGDRSSIREEIAPRRASGERLSDLSAQLKQGALAREDVLSAQKDEPVQIAKPKLHKRSKRDGKRVSRQAELLKAKYATTDEEMVRPVRVGTQSAPPRPQLSPDELRAEAEEARAVLSARIKKLSRRR